MTPRATKREPKKPAARKRRTRTTDAYGHTSKERVSIPTEQTERDVDIAGKTYHASPLRAREPRLQWDRQRAAPGMEHARALHIREKISPQDMISKLSKDSIQTKIFESFNGFEPGAKYRYYNHRSKGKWQNRIIRGDSARVMATLLAHENYKGTVQTVILDPPYGINFDSNFVPAMKDSARSRGVTSPNKLTKDPVACEAFCDSWERGIDSYLDALFHRLCLIRDLLADTGSIFVQIGPENVHRMALLLDEVFGHENAVSTIMFKKSGGTTSKFIPEGSDFLLWYAKDIDRARERYNPLYEELDKKELIEHLSSYAMVEDANGESRPLSPEEKANPGTLPSNSRLFTRVELTSQNPSKTRCYDYEWGGKVYKCPANRHWSVGKKGMDKLAKMGRLVSRPSVTGGDRLRWKRYEDEIPGKRINNQWATTSPPKTLRYAVQTNDPVIERCILMTSRPGDLVLDPTGGSGVTAAVSERHGRRWVLIDASPVSVATMRHYLAMQVYNWYLLQDSEEGARKEAELDGVPHDPPYTNDPAYGFVYSRRPDVSPGRLTGADPTPTILIVNKPYTDRGIRRVTGPFTVESETSSYTISLTDPRSHAKFAARVVGILENNGIYVTKGRHTIKVKNIESVPAGMFYTHTGTINGSAAAVLIAPEFRAVDNRIIQSAADGASKNSIKELVVVAFEFQPLNIDIPAGITVYKVLMNRALQQKELDTTKLDRSFVMVAEPRIKIAPVAKEKWSVEIVGYLTYDPLSGSMVSGDSDDVDCWMIDTDYDRESFYAREIYFPNTKPLWAKNQFTTIEKMLGSDIDSDRWDRFTTLRSSPFSSKTGRIAVKIITTTGNEMVKEVELGRSGD